MIDAGKMNKRIELLAVTYARSTSGGMPKTYESKATVWAEYVVKGGREFYAAQKINPEVTALFRIRCRTDIKPDWRVKYQNREFDVTFIDDATPGELMIHAKELFQNI